MQVFYKDYVKEKDKKNSNTYLLALFLEELAFLRVAVREDATFLRVAGFAALLAVEAFLLVAFFLEADDAFLRVAVLALRVEAFLLLAAFFLAAIFLTSGFDT